MYRPLNLYARQHRKQHLSIFYFILFLNNIILLLCCFPLLLLLCCWSNTAAVPYLFWNSSRKKIKMAVVFFKFFLYLNFWICFLCLLLFNTMEIFNPFGVFCKIFWTIKCFVYFFETWREATQFFLVFLLKQQPLCCIMQSAWIEIVFLDGK